MSSFSAKNDQASALERANFDLKMQIFYLNQKLAAVEKNGISSDNGNNTVAGLLESRFVDITALREENSLSQAKIAELENEILLLKLQLSGLNSSKKTSDDKISDVSSFSSSTSVNVTQIEENRKRERQAAMAIAEHDAAVIARLEQELLTLRAEREADAKEFEASCNRAEKAMMECIEKDSIIQSQKDEIARLNALVNYLKGKGVTPLTPNNNIKNVNGDNASTEPNGRHVGKLTAFNATASTIPSTTSTLPLHCDTTNSATSAPSLESPSSSSSQVPATTAPPMSASLQTPSKTMSSKEFLDFRAQAAWEELHALRNENAKLKEQLERERALMKNQEFALQKVKATAEEITLLEAEEIARLEAELERCMEDRDKWSRNCKVAEAKAKTLRQRVMDMEKSRREEYRLQEDVENAFVNLSSMVAKSQSGSGYNRSASSNKFIDTGYCGGFSSGKFSGNRSGQSSPYRLSSPQSASRDFLRSPTGTIPTSTHSQRAMLEQHQHALDMYKQREAELLNTLERVCLELEMKSAISDR